MIAVLAGLCVAMAPAAQANELSLADLGYTDGLSLQGQGARQTLFFPAPQGAEGARLTLETTFSPALDARSSLTVRIGGEPVATISADAGARQETAIDLPERLLDEAYLPVEIASDLAVGREACADNTRPSVWARLSPASGVAFRGGTPAATLDALWRGITGQARVALRPEPSDAALATALTVMADLRRRGIEPRPTVTTADPPADLPEIIIGEVPWPRVQTVDAGGKPALSILEMPGADGPRRAIWIREMAGAHILAARDELLRGQAAVRSAAITPPPLLHQRRPGEANGERRLSLAQLGERTRETRFARRGAFGIRLPLARVPSGYVPKALVLNARGPELGDDDAVLFNIYANQTYVESLRRDTEVILDRARIPLSTAHLGRTIDVDIAMQRLAPGRPCARGLTTTVQLHDGSYLELAAGRFTPASLGDWTVRYDETIEVLLPDRGEALFRALPLVARLIADGALPGTGIEVVDTASGDGPFVHVTRDTAETYQRPPVTTTRGRVRIADADGRVIAFDPASEVTLIELVQRGSDWGIWIAPGARLELPADQGLGGGNVALMPPEGAPVAIDTRADSVDIAYPDHAGPFALLKRYRDVLFWSVWVVLTVVVATVVIRMRRRQEA